MKFSQEGVLQAFGSMQIGLGSMNASSVTDNDV
jgi:hypothetical protein